MRFINLTPHQINLNDGSFFPSSGTVARVSSTFTEFNDDGICFQEFGNVRDLPSPREGIKFIVSGMVLAALKKSCCRNDCIAPATGHPETVRNDKGHIVSVPGFVA